MSTKFLSVFAVTAILFASCSSDDDNAPEVNDGMVKFSSGITGTDLRVTGDGGDEWEASDKIGIYMLNNSSNAIEEGAENIQYNAQSASTSTSFTSTTPIYYPVDASKRVKFNAYYPYDASLSGNVYNIDLSDQSKQQDLDLMFASANASGAGYTKSYSQPIDLQFNHRLVKIIINAIPGDGIDDLDGLTVKMAGMNTTGTFDLLANTLNHTPFQNEEVTPYKLDSKYTYEATVLPLSEISAQQKVFFTLDGKTYEWWLVNSTPSVKRLLSGCKFIFDVTVKKNEVKVTGKIKPWTTIEGTGTAN